MTTPDLVVVGAGPAGLAAARVACESGLRTLVVDEYRLPGGQYYRQPESAIAKVRATPQQLEGMRIVGATQRAGVTVSPNTLAYAAEDGVLYLTDGSRQSQIRGPVIFATGATERVVPVPGWTLPGVVTCGAAQALAKAHAVPVGSRVLVAGSGPFLFPVAVSLIMSGARVVALVEAQQFRHWPLGSVLGSRQLVQEALHFLRVLVTNRVPILFGHGIMAVEGDDSVSSATVVPLGPDGAPRNGPRCHFDVDAVALSDGFAPSTELCELAGLPLRFGERTRTYLTASSRNVAGLDTVITPVWAAGSCSDEFCSAQLATATGMVAGWAAASTLHGTLTPSQVGNRESARRSVRRYSALARRMARAYPTRPGWYLRVTDDTVICRCENVTAGEIRAAVAAGATDVNLVKRWTRSGMGLCQGRTCQLSVIELTAATSGNDVRTVGRFRPRPPIRPIPLERMCGPVE